MNHPGTSGTRTATIGFIGSGRVGGTVARLAAAAGYTVVIGNSRGPESLTDLVTALGQDVSAASVARVAEAGDLVVVSIPVRAYQELPAGPLAGKTIVDTMNYDPRLHGDIPELNATPVTTSELLQAHLPASNVVKALNNIFFRTLGTLTRPAGAADRTTLPIAGDDAAAKTHVATFLDAIGYDALDAGPLAEGWRWQPGTPAHHVYAGDTVHEAVPAPAAQVREALNAATR